MDFSTLKVRYRQGTSYARGTDVDAYLSPEDCRVLYERWKGEWPEPLHFRGGTKSITCEMVLDVGEAELSLVMGKARAARILEVARINGGR